MYRHPCLDVLSSIHALSDVSSSMSDVLSSTYIISDVSPSIHFLSDVSLIRFYYTMYRHPCLNVLSSIHALSYVSSSMSDVLSSTYAISDVSPSIHLLC